MNQRLAIFLHTLYGGEERDMFNLACGFSARCIQVDLFAPGLSAYWWSRSEDVAAMIDQYFDLRPFDQKI